MQAAVDEACLTPGTKPSGRTHWSWSAAVVVLGALLLWSFRLSGPIDLRWDAGVYYELGRSIANMQGYRIGSEPGSPEAVQYPPALPLLVAVHIWMLDSTAPDAVAPVLRVTFASLFVAYGLAVLALARRYLTPGWAIAVCFITLLQGSTLIASDLLFTEIPFTLTGVLLVLLLTGDWLSNYPAFRNSLAFLLAAVAFFLRTAGVVMLGLWVLDALFRRKWRHAVFRAVLVAVPVIAWQLHVKQVQQSHDYVTPAYTYQRAPYHYYNVPYAENLLLVDPFRPELGRLNASSFFNRWAQNVSLLPQALGEAVNTSCGFWYWAVSKAQRFLWGTELISPSVSRVFIIIVGLASLGGLGLLAWRGHWLLILVVAGTAALTCLTPWREQFGRYLIPATPFLAIGLLYLMSNAASRLPRGRWNGPRIGIFAGGAIVALLVSVQVYGAWYIFTSDQRSLGSLPSKRLAATPIFYFDASWVRWNEAMEWIKVNTPTDAIIGTTSSHLCHLLTGRQSVLPPMEVDPVEATRLMDTVPIAYLVVDEMSFLDTARRYGLPAVEWNPEGWRLVYRNGNTRVFARRENNHHL